MLFIIKGVFGPFSPLKEVEVPIWLALFLKKRQKCQIVVPSWLNLGNSILLSQNI